MGVVVDSAETGRLIVIEGIDGAGSSTQAERLVEWIRRSGRPAALTAEPTKGPIGVLLRQVLKGRVIGRSPDGEALPMDNDVIALLFAADRLDHLACEIGPLLAGGTQVVSDRYYHSSLLYQSLAGDLAWIRELNSHARPPDVTNVLDLSAELAASRRRVRTSEDIYETDAIQTRLCKDYRGLPNLLPDETIVMIDGSESISQVHECILADLRGRFDWQ
jgi:dTMP kinase